MEQTLLTLSFPNYKFKMLTKRNRFSLLMSENDTVKKKRMFSTKLKFHLTEERVAAYDVRFCGP